MYQKLITKPPACLPGLLAAVLFILHFNAFSQLSLTGQLRARGEVRQGFGNLTAEGSVPASFVSQRSRLQFGYKWDRIKFGITLQDVRVWGQDASTTSSADGNRLQLHEGWAEVMLANSADTSYRFKWVDQLSFKIGRQELVYDDGRLLGNVDWLQQGRRFDMALLKLQHHGWQAELGYAYNQNGENAAGTAYVPGNVPSVVKNDIGVLVPTPAGWVPLVGPDGNSSASGSPAFSNPPGTNGSTQDYKHFLSVYLSRKLGQTKISGLFFKDAFSKYRLASASSGGGTVYGRAFDVKGTQGRYTFGGSLNPVFGKPKGSTLSLLGQYYRQLGEDRDGRDLDAWHYSFSAAYSIGKWATGPGYDVLSGNTVATGGNETRRFDPLYGSPHKFWGYMDFFYAGTGSPAAGLRNFYWKTKYTASTFSLAADYHHFAVAEAMAVASGKALGDELDLTANYTLNRFTVVELGYATMRATAAMPIAKNQPLTAVYDKTPQWAYLMINIRPDFLYNGSDRKK